MCCLCNKHFGENFGDRVKSTIHNPFASFFNFKENHIMSNVHTRSWCCRKRLNYIDHPQSFAPKGKSIILIIDDHKKVVVEGMCILDLVNEGVLGVDPFVLIGDPHIEDIKSFWYKPIRSNVNYMAICSNCGHIWEMGFGVRSECWDSVVGIVLLQG